MFFSHSRSPSAGCTHHDPQEMSRKGKLCGTLFYLISASLTPNQVPTWCLWSDVLSWLKPVGFQRGTFEVRVWMCTSTSLHPIGPGSHLPGLALRGPGWNSAEQALPPPADLVVDVLRRTRFRLELNQQLAPSGRWLFHRAVRPRGLLDRLASRVAPLPANSLRRRPGCTRNSHPLERRTAVSAHDRGRGVVPGQDVHVGSMVQPRRVQRPMAASCG